MAALSGASATVAILLCTGFWIASGWSHGYLAAMMAAVGCSLFATLDEPAQAAAKFMKLAIIAILIASVYLLFVLPAVTSFPLLVAALAPVFIPLAAAMASPIHFPVALPVLLTTVSAAANCCSPSIRTVTGWPCSRAMRWSKAAAPRWRRGSGTWIGSTSLPTA